MTPEQAGREIQVCIGKKVKNINQQILSRGMRVANALRNAELEVLSGTRSGRVYRKPYTKRATYRASAPGEAPARRTGALRQRWTQRVDGESLSDGGIRVNAVLQSRVGYSGNLDVGTRKMAPRPFKERIEEKAMPQIKTILKEPYN